MCSPFLGERFLHLVLVKKHLGDWSFLLQLNPDWQVDYESYSWKKLDPDAPETKEMVKEFFLWEGNFGGKKFNQGKVFKWTFPLSSPNHGKKPYVIQFQGFSALSSSPDQLMTAACESLTTRIKCPRVWLAFAVWCLFTSEGWLLELIVNEGIVYTQPWWLNLLIKLNLRWYL